MRIPAEPPLEADAALDLLSEGDVHVLGLLPRASNYTFLAEVSDGDRRTLAVYKPREGETPLWDFPDGTLYLREVAAYLVAEELGWPRVPPTIARNGPEGPGAVQLYIPHDMRQHYFTMRSAPDSEFGKVAAFDAVANNADRKAGHFLLASDGSIWVVDHGVCFSEEPKLRTVVWEFAGDTLPAELRADVERLSRELCDGELRARLLDLLDEREVEATRRRAERLATLARFPHPGPGRPYPWPPV